MKRTLIGLSVIVVGWLAWRAATRVSPGARIRQAAQHDSTPTRASTADSPPTTRGRRVAQRRGNMPTNTLAISDIPAPGTPHASRHRTRNKNTAAANRRGPRQSHRGFDQSYGGGNSAGGSGYSGAGYARRNQARSKSPSRQATNNTASNKGTTPRSRYGSGVAQPQDPHKGAEQAATAAHQPYSPFGSGALTPAARSIAQQARGLGNTEMSERARIARLPDYNDRVTALKALQASSDPADVRGSAVGGDTAQSGSSGGDSGGGDHASSLGSSGSAGSPNSGQQIPPRVAGRPIEQPGVPPKDPRTAPVPAPRLDRARMQPTGDRYATDKGKPPTVEILKVIPESQTSPLMFTADMDIDADGAGGHWESDHTGQSETSLQYGSGQSLNPGTLPFFVLPMDFRKSHPQVALGDLALVRYESSGRQAFALYGDNGPRGTIGEGSIKLAQMLGIPDDPNRGGTPGGVTYIVFPGSRGKSIPRTAEEIQQAAAPYYEALTPEFKPAPGTP
jgi:hypothetical protein